MMMARKKKGLGERHIKILNVLEEYQNTVGYPPAIREIGAGAEITSTSVVNYYLDQLEELGYIERDRKVSRGIRLVKNAMGEALSEVIEAVSNTVEDLMTIPRAGYIGAGIVVQPETDFSLFDAEEGIDVARSMLSTKDQNADLFALEVQGESMIDAMVNDGDIVIMKPAQVANNGEMVAVRIKDENETTLKYFFKEKDHIRLQPANPLVEPIILNEADALEIQGKVVLVIRQVSGAPI